MNELWIALASVPEEGKEIIFDDPEIFEELFKENNFEGKIVAPVKAKAYLLEQADGCLVRGEISGSVTISCDRCTETYTFPFSESFDEYETAAPEKGTPDDEPRIFNRGDGLELDLGQVFWEQFVLALPVRPLCADKCKGLCNSCGANLNKDKCDCEQETGDPRLAVFRNLKLK
ncbi:MAG: YceD family protein [Desulfovibrio sp.]